jgi:hypothetical protein
MGDLAKTPHPRWATWTSAVFHPFLMPLYTLILLYLSDPILHLHFAAFLYLLVVMLVNTVAPAVSLYIMYRRGVISDLDIRNRDQRAWPFLVVLAYYTLTWFIVGRGDNATMIPQVYGNLLLGLVLAISGAILITRQFKLSMHGMAAGGTLGALVAVQTLHFSPAFLLDMAVILVVGLVGSSRLALGVHTHAEVYSGILYGFLVVLLALTLF